jgi:IS30 family transposase
MKKYKKMKFEDRKTIERMLKAGNDVTEIANEVGVHKVTIYNEIRRCPKGEYAAEKAQATL